ncbi:hypothetical protein U9M48_030056 [Paspalum notatum var. saurae]|uniref:Uncharacterized protein n=1 Tax=Paspalum notatum var. saurae TaxID=547442 RepID=A0AAQ3X1R6_PASNO
MCVGALVVSGVVTVMTSHLIISHLSPSPESSPPHGYPLRTVPEQQASKAPREVKTSNKQEPPLDQAPSSNPTMAAKYIIASLIGSAAIAYAADVVVAQKKVFGGTTPSTVSNKEWWQETDKKFQAWPRTAGPPVVMNPISRQNFIVKDLKP